MEDTGWFLAAAAGDTHTVVAELSRGAAIDARNEQGRTALMLAVDSRRIETILALVRAGANLDVQDNIRWTAMTWAVANAVRWILDVPGWPQRAPDTRPMDVLAAAGANVCLREAVTLCDVALALRALDKERSIDVNANALFFAHATFLTLAVETGSLPMVSFLVGRGAQIDARDDAECTALMIAAGMGDAPMVTSLLDLGADVKMGWPDETALSTAERAGRRETALLLLDRGAKKRLVDAIETGDVSLAASLLRDGAGPNGQHLRYGGPRAQGGAPSCRLVRDVMFAAATGNVEMVRLFLENGAAQYLDYCDEHSLLTEAARLGHLEVVRGLLDRGADPNIAGKDGLTALGCAVDGRHLAIEELLKEAGATA
jgi:uncharacterized protein